MEERKIIFSHRRALGDGLMFTSGIRDFKLLFPDIKINVDSNQLALWDNNPYLDRSLKKGQEGIEYHKVGYPMIATVNNINMHFTSMFLFDMIAVADAHKKLPINLSEFCASFANGDVGDPGMGNLKKNTQSKEPFISYKKKYSGFGRNFSRQRGDIYLTQKEKDFNLLREIYNIDKYWVVAPGGKRDCTSKVWDWRKFQEVIDYFDGLLKFVVIGKSDLLIENLRGTVDLVDKFNNDLRSLMSVVYHSEGCISGPSFLMHLASSIPPKNNKQRKPCVSIFGGREPAGWSWYTNHQILHTNGVFTCCDNGGCWTARTHPLPKDPKHNSSLCKRTVKIEDRTIQACMNSITSQDVIRAIEKYYDGNIYSYSKRKRKKELLIDSNNTLEKFLNTNKKEINLLGNLNSKGGGEQSFCTIAKLLMNAGWKVNVFPCTTVNDKFKNIGLNIQNHNFSDMYDHMKPGLPLFFYANDTVWDFCQKAQKIVEKSSVVIIGINFCNGDLPRTNWISKSKKLKLIVFQNEEKKKEFERDEMGFEDTKLEVLYGAIELDKFLEVCFIPRDKDLVVLKHCMPDYRKYTTKQSVNSGEKIHIWQKHLSKELDTKFYTRLLKDTKNMRFEFMEAHKELVDCFKNEPRMIFHKFDSISVMDFLKRGHVYLYRTSNAWRDNYPRCVAEALASGIPVITEPRDGTWQRLNDGHGDRGFFAVHYDEYLVHLKTLQRKENYRQAMGRNAKDWARENLRPEKWVDLIENSVLSLSKNCNE